MPVQTESEILAEISSVPFNNLSKAALAVALGTLIYQYITAPTPLSSKASESDHENDLKRYRMMCTLYTTHLKKPTPPKEWGLTSDSTPIYSTNLMDSSERFRTNIETLRYSSLPMKTIIIKMTASIESLFKSIRKRTTFYQWTWEKYRPDGFEVMFFSELVHWLTLEMSAASTVNQETADNLMARIQYCKAVKRDVFFYRNDQGIHNPYDCLVRITDDLEVLHQDICKSIEAASFNQLIHSIDSDLLDMCTASFDVLYLSLKDVNQEDLQVSEFLHPNPKNDQKIIRLGQLLLGQWLKQTLKTAGVVANNFQGSNINLDMNTVEQHLNLDIQKLEIDDAIGLNTFVLDHPTLTKPLLEKIKTIHKTILNIYFVRKSLVNSAQLGTRLGETWLYYNDEGQVIVRALLHAIEDAGLRLADAINDYWKSLYTDTFLPYKQDRGMDNTSKMVRFLQSADGRVTRIQHCSKRVKATIEAIETKAKSSLLCPMEIRKIKQTLIQDLREYARRSNNTPSDLMGALDILASHTEKSKDEIKVTTLVIRKEAITEHIVRFPKEKLPIYQLSRELSHASIEGPLNLTLLRPRLKEEKYHTAIQRKVYEQFLQPYHAKVNSNFFMSGLYTAFGFNMAEFKKIYSSINTVMSKLYDESILTASYLCQHTTKRFKPGSTTEEESIPTENISRDDLSDSEYIDYQNDLKEKTYWNTQLALLDQWFQIMILNLSMQFDKPRFGNLVDSSHLEVLKAKEMGQNVEISIDPKLLQFAAGAFDLQLKAIEKALQCEKVEHQKTKDALVIAKQETATARVELKDANALLQEKERELAGKNDELVKKDSELKKKDSELEKKDSELEKKDSELEKKDSELKKKDSELKKKDSELKKKDSELAEYRASLERLQAQFRTFNTEGPSNCSFFKSAPAGGVGHSTQNTNVL